MMMAKIKIIGLLKTLGVKAGEKMDISESKEEVVFAVSTAILLQVLFLSKFYIVKFRVKIE